MFPCKQLRLGPRGPRKQKFFSLVVCYKQTRQRGAFLERLGFFQPHRRQRQFALDSQRLSHGLNRGLQVHPSTFYLLSHLARA